MQNTFGFYNSICGDFFENLGSQVAQNSLDIFLQDELRPRLFEQEICAGIGERKKSFLTEIIKLEQFIQGENYTSELLNDLESLKQVADAIYELMQNHWELFKYESSHVNSQTLISFILEIDRIGIGWDAYLEKYLAVSRLLNAAKIERLPEGQALMTVKYHLPPQEAFTLDMATAFHQFLQVAFDFILKAHGKGKESPKLALHSLEVSNPIACTLIVPQEFLGSFEKLLGYLSVDVLKRDTLVKFVMEVVRLGQAKPLAKASVNTIQKNIAKALKALHPEGFFSVNQNENADSVELLTTLCEEMDRLKIRYKDLLSGSTSLLVRNRKEQMEAELMKSQEDLVVSTVTIDVEKKEHINFLTS